MLTHGALHRLAIDRPPVSRAFKFRSLTRAIIPPNRHLEDKEGGRLQDSVDNAVNCEIFGTHVLSSRLPGVEYPCLHVGGMLE